MTKVECLKRIYDALGGSDYIVPHDETVCDVLHKIGDCIGDFVEELEEEVEEAKTKHIYTTEETEIGKWIDRKTNIQKGTSVYCRKCSR